MKKLALALFALTLLFIEAGLPRQAYSQESLLDFEEEIPTVRGRNCVVAGCSGELCVETGSGSASSICIWKEEFACYRNAVCERQPNDRCGWTMTEELRSCLGTGGSSMPPSTFPSPIVYPVPSPNNNLCGNRICDAGEADYTDCPVCVPGQPCPLRACYYRPGSCTADCPKPPTPTSEPNQPGTIPFVKPTPPPGCQIFCPNGYVTSNCRCESYPSLQPNATPNYGSGRPWPSAQNGQPFPSVPGFVVDGQPGNGSPAAATTPLLLRPFTAFRNWWQNLKLDQFPLFKLFFSPLN